MVGRRWLRMLGTGMIAMGGLAAIGASAPPGPGSGTRPWVPAECGGAGMTRLEVASARPPGTIAEVAGSPWFRVDPVIDGDGALTGNRLTFGINGARRDRTVDLPAEAFAAGPFGGLVLAGSDDGARSSLVSFDVDRACRSSIAETADVIRGATLDPAGRTIYEHRVDRASRTDLGIWERPLDGSRPARLALGPIGPDARFGRTWSTGLSWSTDDARLVVQSCGAVACRTRLLDVETGGTTMVDDPELGLLVGVAGDRLVTHRACRGLPCPVVSVGWRTGHITTLERDGGWAVLVGTGADVAVVVEALGNGSSPRLRRISFDGRTDRDLGVLPSGSRLSGDPGWSASGIGLPPGHVLLTPDGRLPDTSDRSRVTVRSLDDGHTAPFDEVTR